MILDEMGLGKTRTALATVKAVDKVEGNRNPVSLLKTLFIGPLSVLDSLMVEYARCYPGDS